MNNGNIVSFMKIYKTNPSNAKSGESSEKGMLLFVTSLFFFSFYSVRMWAVIGTVAVAFYDGLFFSPILLNS